MMLSQFILANIEEIVLEWEKFARTLPLGVKMNQKALRNDALTMLTAVAHDMATAQSGEAQDAKSRGLGIGVWEGKSTAAEDHGSSRLSAGFDLPQLVSEYRALRASVIRLWNRENPSGASGAIYEMTRFNEAIDQALIESTVRYTAEVDRARDLFAAVLGHDLRSPLAAILLSANSLLMSDRLSGDDAEIVTRIVSSAERIQKMVADLLDVARVRLGGAMSISLQPMDLARTCERAVAEAQALHPDRSIQLTVTGDVRGNWDDARLAQMLSNLLQNAIRHGAPDKPVTVSADGEDDEVRLSVHNPGKPISEAILARIFEPMVWTDMKAEAHSLVSSGLGLGLYIASAIAEAHLGCIRVESTEETGTTFTVVQPRNPRRLIPGPALPGPRA